MTELSKKTEERYCETHKKEKEKLENTFLKNDYYWCEECSSEQDAISEEREKERQIDLTQKSINKRLENAMITPRFAGRDLDNFKMDGPAQTTAKNAAIWFLENMDNTTGMIFVGKPGTGKNHLATGIIKKAVTEYKKTALITEAIKIVRRIKESWRNEWEKESEIISLFVSPDILVIDEIGVQFGSETEQMYLTEIINDRYNNKRPTIIMGNLNVSELEDRIGARAIDRLREGGKIVIFDWDSYRSKV